MLNMPNEEMDYDDIDPELREAAERMGLDEEGVRALQQQMYEQQLGEDESDQEEGEDEDDLEGQ